MIEIVQTSVVLYIYSVIHKTFDFSFEWKNNILFHQDCIQIQHRLITLNSTENVLFTYNTISVFCWWNILAAFVYILAHNFSST